jgi:hypothetical protein
LEADETVEEEAPECGYCETGVGGCEVLFDSPRGKLLEGIITNDIGIFPDDIIWLLYTYRIDNGGCRNDTGYQQKVHNDCQRIQVEEQDNLLSTYLKKNNNTKHTII